MSKRMLGYFKRIDEWLIDRLIFGDNPNDPESKRKWSRVQRFKDDYIKEDGCDSEEEENLAH